MGDRPAAPVLHFERGLPDDVAALIEGRAVAVGPADIDLAGADGVIAGVRRWDGPAMDLAPNLRVISRAGIGYDAVDLAAASERGITVCYAPDAPTVSTAEHTVALLLAVTKDLAGWADRSIGAPATPPGLELDGATLGLYGYGRIARRVGVVGRALGMRVIAHDPYVADPGGDGTALVDADTLWSQSDVVSLHAPATPATHHIVDAAVLGAMKPGAYLVNCARGALVDQEALLDALTSGHLAGAGLDVTEPEPLPADHPLRRQRRVVVTPHIASQTATGRRRLYADAIDNALAVIAGTGGCVVPEQRQSPPQPKGAAHDRSS
ncbi:MAG: NAD(P)-dependent oxidoreductase [Desertimonas sp.]